MEFDPPFEDAKSDTDSDRTESQRQDSVSSDVSQDKAFLTWAPRSHKREIKPTLRFLVLNQDDQGYKGKIKYFTLHQDKGYGITYTPSLYSSDVFLQSQPFAITKGDYNQGKICFFKEKYMKDEDAEAVTEEEVMAEEEADEEEDDPEDPNVFFIDAQVLDEFNGPLPELEPEAIWPEKPRIEYVDLKGSRRRLRPTAPFHCSDRTSIVTHPDFPGRMVRKIWPSPMCTSYGIEREMMAYRACDGKDITPQFMGHVTEDGRVVGMLIEYIEGAHKPRTAEEKDLCRDALERFHNLTGWHRNPMASHKDNFLIKDGCAYIIDLEEAYTPEDVAPRGPDWPTKDV